MHISQYLPALLSATGMTLCLTFSSLAVGLLLAFCWFVMWRSRVIVLSVFAKTIVFVLRGTPLLVQFFLIYYGSAQFDWLRESFLWTFLKQPFYCAVIVLSLNTSAYTSILLLGAIRSVPIGEIDACKAMGFSRWKMFLRIVMPRAMRIALPAYSNEVIMVLKGTSLASTITLMDLMGVTQHLIAMTYDTMYFFFLSGLVYFLLNGLIIFIFRCLERKLIYQV